MCYSRMLCKVYMCRAYIGSRHALQSVILLAPAYSDFACKCNARACLQMQCQSVLAFAKFHFASDSENGSLCFFLLSVCIGLHLQNLFLHLQYYILHMFTYSMLIYITLYMQSIIMHGFALFSMLLFLMAALFNVSILLCMTF